MNILQGLPCFYPGGVEQYTLRVMKAFQGRHEMALLAPDGPGRGLLKGSAVEHSSFRKLEFDLLTGFHSLKSALRRQARLKPVDLVHAHVEALLLPVVGAALPGVPRVFATHGIWARSGLQGLEGAKFKMTAWAINRWSEAAYAVSRDQLDKLIAHGANPEKLCLIENGVQPPRTSDLAPKDILARFGIDPQRHIVVATLARLSKDKALDTLIQEAALLRDSHPDLRWVIAGEGPEKATLERMISRLGLNGIVVLAGFVQPAGDLLKSANIYAQPSAHEAFSLAILEAMSMGLPVVASQIGGIDEQVVEGKTGLMCAQGDANSFAQAFAQLARSPEDCKWMGMQGQARYRALFTEDRMIARLQDLYDRTALHNRSMATA